ncbi:hypothetical protein [Secundilactobacillus oryzae]|uniref:hypothetical protein n=1 Tax=Secundilactobacillus oryzae TaxID=1202668 RepID=UPI0012685658|nr:hypothetical protein [Secundilactobacillus oryzae]
MPYKDLFEQKGPLVFLLHTVAALISKTNFIGIYFLESLALGFSMLGIRRILANYLNLWSATFLTLISPALIGIGLFFRGGDTVEAFITPLLVGLLVLLFNHRNEAAISFTFRELLIQAILATIVFWMKYTLIGPWLVFFLAVACHNVFNKNWPALSKLVRAAILGFTAITAPLLFFYWIMSALDDLFHIYFYVNLHYYTDSGHLTMLARLIQPIQNLWQTGGILIPVVMLLAIIRLVIGTRFITNRFIKQVIVGSLVSHYLLMFIGGNTFTYYWEGFAAYLCLALISFGIPIYNKLSHPIPYIAPATAIFVALVLPFVSNQNYLNSRLFPNNPMITYPTAVTSHPQQYAIRFGNIIQHSPHAKVLNFGVLDLGVYLTSGTTPPTKYFSINNLPTYKPMHRAQIELVRHRQVKFVVTRIPYGTQLNAQPQKRYQVLHQNYRVITKQSAVFEDHIFTYLLLTRR